MAKWKSLFAFAGGQPFSSEKEALSFLPFCRFH
jgi:hypothetical protein